ncbi:DUF5994 family protein [Actinoplanes sp. TRM 88003]|uniref:DUF5994 family protein n=1 Tax=Paractinoplanes aksuensis TaxID=2939490 RepID=A0ABT1DPA4_9ACTN|nr:DUF5994 family protein [Actinoplanes aksuensis]MCO8271571.1 DUF5994 family protein [Actinoplanes aksuensis]
MTPLEDRSDPVTAPRPRAGLEPADDNDLLLDDSWWPRSDNLGAQLRVLLPALDQLCGPVTRLLLGAAGWTARPHQVVLADRTVSLGYLAGQPRSMMTVRCLDGGTFTVRVAPSEPVTARHLDPRSTCLPPR